MAVQDLTPDEMEIVRQIIASQKQAPEPGPADLMAGAPAPANPAAPYQAQAAQYNMQADTLDKQAAVPAPQPVGAKQHLVEAARAAMENFGRLGAPGGYYGQEAQREKDFKDENTQRISRAKDLRTQAQQQQDLGQRADFQNTEMQNQQANTAISQQRANTDQQQFDLQKQIANRPVRVNETDGSQSQAVDPDTQKAIPGTQISNPKDPSKAPPPKTVNTAEGVLQYYPETDSWKRIGGLRPNAPPASGGMQVVQAEGPDGKPTYTRISTAGPEGPVQVGGAALHSKPAEAPTQLKNQADSAKVTGQMAQIVRTLVTTKPQLVGPAAGRINELMLKFGGDPAGIVAAANGMQPGEEKDAALLSGHLAYLFLNEARATMPGRPSKDYMDFVKSRSAAMSQNPQIIEGFLQSAENNAKIIKELAKSKGYDVDVMDQQQPATGGSGSSTDSIRARLGLPPKGQ